MLDRDHFYPVLNRRDWRGAQDCLTAEFLKGDVPGALLVSYAEVTKESNNYLTREYAKKLGVQGQNIHKTAVTNLRERKNQPQWSLNDSDGVRYAMRIGDEVTSSEILLPSVLIEAQVLLGGEGPILISVPNRFCIIAAGLDQIINMHQASRGMFEEAKNDTQGALSAIVYMVENGKIIGLGKTPQDSQDKPVNDSSRLKPELALGLILVPLVVGGSDGDLDEKERQAAFEFMERYHTQGKNTTVRAIIELFMSQTDAVTGLLAKENAVMSGMLTFKMAIEQSMTTADKKTYVKFLLDMAEHIAGASGGGFFGLGSKISKSERKSIEAIRVLLLSDLGTDSTEET